MLNLNQRDYLKDLGIDRKVILKYILKKYFISVWTGFIWPRTGHVVEVC